MSALHPKDRYVVGQLFGSAAVPIVERGVVAARTPTGQTVVKVAKAAGVLAAFAIVVGSVDLRT
jgi:hypothetical protein